MAETLTTIWARELGGTDPARDGSTYDKAFTFEECINFINDDFNQPLTEDVDIYLAAESDGVTWTLPSTPSQITVKGNAYSRVSFSGRDPDGNRGPIVFLGLFVDYVFGSESEMEYFSFRDIWASVMNPFPAESTQGAMFWFPNHVRQCHFYECFQNGGKHLMSLATSTGAELMATVVRCRGKNMNGEIFNFGVHGGVTVIECTAHGASGAQHCFSGGGTYMRCIASVSSFNGFHNIRDAVALTAHDCINGIVFNEDSLTLVSDCVVTSSSNAAVLMTGDDSLVLARRLATFDYESRISGSVFEYDIDDPGLPGLPYIDVAGENWGLNDGHGNSIRDLSFFLPGHASETYHDIGAVESVCAEAPEGDSPFTGTVLNRGVA